MNGVTIDSLRSYVNPPPIQNWQTVRDEQGRTIITVRKYFHTVELSNCLIGPLPPEFLSWLCKRCSYTHKTVPMGYGEDSFDPITGERYRIKTQVVNLYHLDENGRFCTLDGYLDEIVDVIQNRGYAFQLFDQTPPPPRPNAFELHLENLGRHRITLKKRQDEFLAILASAPGGILQATVAFGKSFSLATLATILPYARIGIMVPGRQLLDDMYKALGQFSSSVGKIGDGKKEKDARVLAVSLDSIHECPTDLDILVVDEVHKAVGGQYGEKLAGVFCHSHARMFGASATPYDRFDGAHARLDGLFGPRRFQLLYPEAVELGLVVQIVVEWNEIYLNKSAASSFMSRAMKKRQDIWANQDRNRIIANRYRELPADEQILVLVDTLEFGLELRKMLPEFELVYGGADAKRIAQLRNKGIVRDDFVPMTKKMLEKLKDDFRGERLKKVIATSVWATGVDFRALSCVSRPSAIAANGIADEQGPGRGSRLCVHKGKTSAKLIEFYDRWDGGLERSAYDRSRNYAKRGWKQVGAVPTSNGGVRYVEE